MSDKIRSLTGRFLILTAVLLCLIPLTAAQQTKETVYSSGKKASPPVVPIATAQEGTIRVNTADPEELTQLPGIGETIASFIIGERDTDGPYYYPEDLVSVKGIGLRRMEQYRYLIDLSPEESEEQNGIPRLIP